MTFRTYLGLIVLMVAPATVAATSEPEAVQLLREALKPAPTAYMGKLMVVSEGAKRRRKLDIWYAPGGCLRWDILGPKGSMVRTMVWDKDFVWFYDRIRRAAWKGGPQYIDQGPRMVSEQELDLLAKNYSVRLLPRTMRVAHRICRVLEVVSPQGGRVKQLWLDQDYGLPLEIKSYGQDGSLSSSIRFIQIEFTNTMDEKLFHFFPPPGTEIISSLRRPNYMDSDQSIQGERNPTLPRWVPPGFQLESSDMAIYRGARVLHSRYSNGAQALALFQCPDKVRLAPQDIVTIRLDLKVGGHAELAQGVQWPGENGITRILQWRSHRRRFILVGQLPVNDMKQMAESLP